MAGHHGLRGQRVVRGGVQPHLLVVLRAHHVCRGGLSTWQIRPGLPRLVGGCALVLAANKNHYFQLCQVIFFTTYAVRIFCNRVVICHVEMGATVSAGRCFKKAVDRRCQNHILIGFVTNRDLCMLETLLAVTFTIEMFVFVIYLAFCSDFVTAAFLVENCSAYLLALLGITLYIRRNLLQPSIILCFVIEYQLIASEPIIDYHCYTPYSVTEYITFRGCATVEQCCNQ